MKVLCCECGKQGTSDAKGSLAAFAFQLCDGMFYCEKCIEQARRVAAASPSHYVKSGKIRDYVVADDWGLPAILAQALKYIKRHRLKGHPVQDLRKAVACVELAIEQLKENDDE